MTIPEQELKVFLQAISGSVDCDPIRVMVLCGGSGSSNADAATDASGNTTMSGDIAAGGCAIGVSVIVQGFAIGCPATCLTAIEVKSPDMNGDLVVNLPDLALFGAPVLRPILLQILVRILTANNLINLQDFSVFGLHYNHVC